MDILIKILDEDLLQAKLPEFIDILEDEPGEYWRESHFLLPLSQKYNLSIIAIAGDKVAGYIIASLKEHGPYIHKFMVRKDLRGRSTGRRMLIFFEKIVSEKKFSSISLTVREENERAINFYKKNMFEVTGSRIDRYNNFHLLFMTKSL